MANEFATFPARDEIAVEDKQSGKLLIPRPWIDWFTALTTRVSDTPNRMDVVTLGSQNASIGTTVIPMENFGVGLYRMTYYVHIIQPATVSSSLTIILGWTDQGVTCLATGAAITTNLITSTQSNTVLIRSDEPPILTYATTYASSGATPMLYNLDVIVEVMATT